MRTAAFSFFLAVAFALICLAVCGISLGLFLAGFFLLTCLLPPLVLLERSTNAKASIAACVLGGIGMVWLFAAFTPDVTFAQWLKCEVILIAYATLIGGIAIALLRLRIAPLAASAITVTLSLIWLTAPVWLASNLSDTGVSRLVAIHPLFAINGVLSNLGTWSHFPIAYRELTTLGQDIPYSLPTMIWPCMLAHLIPGAVLWWLASWRVSATAELSEGSPSSAAGQS